MKIKKCSLDDILDLQKIYRQTFFETFSEQNSEENMRIFLNKAYSEEKLKSEIENKESETFLAVENQKILGVLKINTGNAETESGLENSLEIQRIYILKESKGLGIGTVLMNLAEKKARELGVSFIWLGVWEKNFPAQKFYTDKGFRRFSEHAFVLGDDIQTDFLMKKELS
ncbi:MAG: GNAT family N-acetyltransferase [Treponema succinifaciens]|uniref:GNAT family N-acetyltransferase n=1 Tax=Treponema succinifaciens TaxID=167 RepID=UPI002A75D081|nr:GNAT family N-acetyltransferase [Treponema succinifaciens]MDY2615172.1 GNAT family N-acetyltransferase [Treponema succinifaciens]